MRKRLRKVAGRNTHMAAYRSDPVSAHPPLGRRRGDHCTRGPASGVARAISRRHRWSQDRFVPDPRGIGGSRLSAADRRIRSTDVARRSFAQSLTVSKGPANVDKLRAVMGGAAKRSLDVVLGTILALLALPTILILSVVVCISLRTFRPFFLQNRVGFRGRPFTIVKLRTLPLHAPPAADKYTIAATVRTTRVGRLLRATHLDELPQLLLVPLGRMSLVGPRPEMPELLAGFDESFVAARLRVRPGCTGLWQVSVDAGRLIGEAPEYDLYYLRHAGVRLDAWVLWRSLVLVTRGRAVSCADVPLWAQRRASVLVKLPEPGPDLAREPTRELRYPTVSASG